MFNKERKEQFLRERKSVAEIANNTESGFKFAEFYENSYGKDLCEWTTIEILGFFKYYGTAKIQSLINLKSSFQIYTNWCLKNGLVPDSQNHYMEITTQDLCRCIDLNKLRRLVVTRDELLSGLHKIPNYSDRFIILGIFEGISTKNHTLAKISFDQVEGNKIVTPNRTYIISDELFRIICVAEQEKERIVGGGKPDEPYAESPYIVRPTVRANAQRNPCILIGSRFRRGLSEMGFSAEITQRDLAESGRLEYLKKKMTETGLSFVDVEKRFREEHEKMFGTIQNYTVYHATYGSLVG